MASRKTNHQPLLVWSIMGNPGRVSIQKMQVVLFLQLLCRHGNAGSYGVFSEGWYAAKN